MKPDRTTRQLADATLQLLSQNRLLEELRNDLRRIAGRIPVSEPVGRELRERVGRIPHQSIDWEQYDRQFSEIFPEFLATLGRRSPEMTSTEVRICTMVRMHLKSREIARLMGISESGAEYHRRNIRRKLKLGKEEKLVLVLGAM